MLLIKGYKGTNLVNMEKVEVIKKGTRMNPSYKDSKVYIITALFSNDYEGEVLYETRHEEIADKVLTMIEEAVINDKVRILDLQTARNKWLDNEELI